MLVVVPPAIWIAWRARRLEPAGRWGVTLATVLLALACINPQVQCDRPLSIVAWVDVSPSTRGATFRDSAAVTKKLEQLAPRREVSVRYFANGAVSQPAEAKVGESRLPETTADAVLLFSDGVFDSPAQLPPVYAVVDPSLTDPPDGRIDALRADDANATIVTYASTSDRRLSVGGQDVPIPRGPFTVIQSNADARMTAQLNRADAWPENDTLAAARDPVSGREIWFIDRAEQLPTEPAAYLDPSAIVLRSSITLSPTQQDRLVQYVRDLGGALIATGSTTGYAPGLKSILPLSATPPEPKAKWLVLLDASGSMAAAANGSTRWDASLFAAKKAVERLDEQERVTIAMFARSTEMIASDITPAEAIARLDAIRMRSPSGPTGLEAALRSVIESANGQPTRLLVVSDADVTIAEPAALIARLREARISVFLLATTSRSDDAPLRALCEQTGGQLLSQTDPSKWTNAAELLIAAARGEDAVPGNVALQSASLPVPVTTALRYLAFAKGNADVVATMNDEPVVARWQVGLGQSMSIAAEIDRPTLELLAQQVQRNPADPRFTFIWDERAETVDILAAENQKPLNELTMSLRRGDAVMTFDQIAPGRYLATLARSGEPTLAVIEHAGRVIERRAIASRYAREFDRIGNDVPALRALAERTGGRLIEPGDPTPIDFAHAKEWRTARPWLASVGTGVLMLTIIVLRAPYLVDRIRRRFRNH